MDEVYERINLYLPVKFQICTFCIKNLTKRDLDEKSVRIEKTENGGTRLYLTREWI